MLLLDHGIHVDGEKTLNKELQCQVKVTTRTHSSNSMTDRDSRVLSKHQPRRRRKCQRKGLTSSGSRGELLLRSAG